MIAEAADLEFALIGMLYRDHGNEEKNLDLKHERSDHRKVIRLASSDGELWQIWMSPRAANKFSIPRAIRMDDGEERNTGARHQSGHGSLCSLLGVDFPYRDVPNHDQSSRLVTSSKNKTDSLDSILRYIYSVLHITHSSIT